jgi:hypothetical protein
MDSRGGASLLRDESSIIELWASARRRLTDIRHGSSDEKERRQLF